MSEGQGRSPLWTSAEIETATGGVRRGPFFQVSGIDIDSRELAPGDLFVALTAERDGHEFVEAARARGAAGVLASRPVAEPYVLVDDTLVALGRLARAARDRAAAARRGAVTGSVGKTSVTQAVLAGLRRAGGAHGSVRSFNNHIGVPLTLARMPADTRRAVFEMGMNHAGEIAPLSRLVRPHAVAITNVEAVHVENFDDGAAGVARAKAEILEGLEPGGGAILNADNPWFEELAATASRAGARILAFGSAPNCAARLTAFSPNSEGASVEAEVLGRPVNFALRQSAPHWGPMSLCALLMMVELGVTIETGLEALAAFEPLAGRGSVLCLPWKGGEILLVDESYNASPVSMSSALRALGARPAAGRRVAVLTDMLELGADALAAHRGLASVIAAQPIDAVFCAGPLMRGLFDALDPTRRGGYAPDAGALIDEIGAALAPGDVVMVKGSHASRASAIVAALVERAAPRDDG
ncbi:MAG: UDP-N-acetylmuramoyl-tripeptide--D-alanyl-D-alanine ligase [Caulobacteraceae bacterium]|nr:UDP-N-acetylmuramoyl-tripeptide--D-alanyl-D-alanine ligase [Caulobacteraceae bacterium]